MAEIFKYQVSNLFPYQSGISESNGNIFNEESNLILSVYVSKCSSFSKKSVLRTLLVPKKDDDK